MNKRFTRDGSDRLEQHLEQVCERARDGVEAIVPPRRLEGLLLGGGYGRGEGGVLRTEQGDQPYNDLEFYVLVRGCKALNERRHRQALHGLGEILSSDAGLDVEFKVLSLRTLRASPPNMFYYDLVMGHRWFGGDDTLLAGCEHHRDAARIPLHEATRLLMNRCCGLFFSAGRLVGPSFSSDDADFVGRNLAKTQLALGDVLLAGQGKYHWSCRERHDRLLALAAKPEWPWLAALQQHHTEGVAFKMHPRRTAASRAELAARHADLLELGRWLWLWIENRRLGTTFANIVEYAASRQNKCPETSALRNWLINVRYSRQATSCRYPRERLLKALALALWAPGSVPGGDADRPEGIESLWRRFG